MNKNVSISDLEKVKRIIIYSKKKSMLMISEINEDIYDEEGINVLLNELLKSMFSTNIKGFISINNKMTIKGSTMSLLYDIVYELIELNNNKYIMIVISKIKNNIKLKAIIDTKETLKDKIKLDKNIKIKENKYDNDTEIEFIISEVKSK